MKYESSFYLIKTNIKIEIRSLVPEDSAEVLRHRLNVANSTVFMNPLPGEVDRNDETIKSTISDYLESKRSIFLGAFIENKLVGTCAIAPVSKLIKLCHRGDFGMSVDVEYRNMGIGKLLLKTIIDVASLLNYDQIELTVVSTNIVAKRLYESFGFIKTGTIPKGFKIDDETYLDHDLMILDLN